MSRWVELEPPQPGRAETRLVLHYAAQLVAAVGQSLAPKQPDDSQQSLSLAETVWLGVPVAGGRRRAGLEPSRLELCLCDEAGVPQSNFPLAGRTMDDGLRFLAGELGHPLALPTHPADFPHHAIADGAPFPIDGDAAARAQVAALFAGTQAVLEPLREGQPLRLWPHHFDFGCSLQFGPLSLGLGVSPGDGAAGPPYWYATFWPAPARFPPLSGGGTWRHEGWAGAELPLSRLAPGPDVQRAQLDDFFRSAVAAARALA
jgi:hypothetical protein